MKRKSIIMVAFPMGFVLITSLIQFQISSIVSLPKISFVFIFALVAVIAALFVYYVGKHNYLHGSLLYTLLFSSLFIGIYATTVYLASAHFIPT